MSSKARQHLEQLLGQLQVREHRAAAVQQYAAVGDGAAGFEATTDTTCHNHLGRQSHAVLSHIEHDYRTTIARLEDQVLELSQACAAQQAQYESELSTKQHIVDELQEQLQSGLADLQRRQSQVEASTPLLQDQLRHAKEQLKSLHISEALYAELASVPEEQRTLADAAKLATYEALQELRQEAERLRMSAAAAREVASRSEQELARVQRENMRVAADAAAREQEAELAVVAMQDKVKRLESQLSSQVVSSEVAAAKVQMYDELMQRAEELADENQRLRASQTALERAEGDLLALKERLKEKDHKLEALAVDKVYLSREVEALQEREQRFLAEADQKAAKILDLKKAKQQLMERLTLDHQDSKLKDAERLETEVLRIRAAAQADLDRVRRETSEAHEREVRLMKDMRDAAIEGCQRAQAAFKDLQASYEELQLAHRDLQKRADLRSTEQAGEVKLKAFEVDRLQLMYDEKHAALVQAELQVDLLQEKVRVVTNNYYELEADRTRRMAELQAENHMLEQQLGHFRVLEGQIDEGVLALTSGKENEPAGSLQLVSPMVRKRMQQTSALATRCAKLEQAVASTAQARDDALQQVANLRADLAAASMRAQRSAQPQAYLMDQLLAAERTAQQAQQRAQAAEAQLAQEKAQHAAICADLEQVLKERTSVDSIRRVLTAALQDPKTTAKLLQNVQQRVGAAQKHAAVLQLK
ncbi:hypothetical protein WJX72_009955 [[Myrmecia] bisecta]|uniref:Uncharacterized protein n=1 Tax=[Myrmecia] bisecta TaxID=41462 RepID=A0AAW1Q714_9CHLO